jgi:prepilin-type N-terminal cleavage/methylation domain-containing protein/prepilin-type processing-associated H-X9-DG protein
MSLPAYTRLPISSGCRKGFTLVELLVVIGIIALLISILIPALTKAKTVAQRAACLSNLRQLSYATLMYINANRGVFPPHKQTLADPTSFWGDCIMPYLASGNAVNPKPFDDPAQGSETVGENFAVWQFAYDCDHISYGYNAYFLGHYCYSDNSAFYPNMPEYLQGNPTGEKPTTLASGYIKPYDWMKITMVKHSSDCIMFGDSSPPAVFSLWWPKAAMATKATDGPATDGYGSQGIDCVRHKGMGCVAFCDGHAELRYSKDINPKIDPGFAPDTTANCAIRWWDPLQRP